MVISVSKLKVYGNTSMFVSSFLKGGQLVCVPVCCSGRCSPSEMGSTLKRKTLLP